MAATKGEQKICRLNVNGLMVSGAGATEEEARENVLKQVREMVHHSPVLPSANMSMTANTACFGGGGDTTGNMVGRLQEMCVAKHWPLPVYNLLDSQGPSHMPHFVMACSVKDLVAVGNGKTKKEAKHHAAKRLLDSIRGDGSVYQGSVRVHRALPMCAPSDVRRDVKIVLPEQHRHQSPSLEGTRIIRDYCTGSPLCNSPFLALKANGERERILSPERVPLSISEISESSEEPIPLPSVEDYLCGSFQDHVKIHD